MNHTQHLHESIKTWIAYDLPPAEKEALSPAMIDCLEKRLAESEEPDKPKVKKAKAKKALASFRIAKKPKALKKAKSR